MPKKMIALIGTSDKSWDDAVRQVAKKAAESIGKIDSIDVVHQSVQVDSGGEISQFRVTVHVCFETESETGNE